jgi:ABC-type phosphate transport system permease subunit
VSKPDMPAVLQGVILVIQRIHGNAQPSVTCVAQNDHATLKQVMANINVLEAEAYEVTGVTMVGSKSVAIAADGVFEKYGK